MLDQASPYNRAGRPACVELRLKSQDKVLEVDFADGKSFRFTTEFLRVESPSAEVQGHGPQQRSYIGGRRHVNIIAIEPVGSYAVRLKFDDLHDTGIYSWEYFYDRGHDQDELWAKYLAALAERGLKREPR